MLTVAGKRRGMGLICGLLGLAGLGMILGVMPVRAENRPADSTISYWVRDALLENPRVPSETTSVFTDDGIVKLTGSVPSLAAKELSELETKKIAGVRGVINELKVDAPLRFDFDIEQDILKRILNSSDIHSRGVRVDVSDGTVTLTGSVDSWAEAKQAELLASETLGVKEVKNELVPRYQRDRSNAEVRADVESTLARDIYLTGLPITVSVANGVVTLKGDVGTDYQRDRAYRDVRWIWNVKGVKNDLNVVWWENEGTRTKTTAPTDNGLKRTVEEELEQDLRLEASGIRVEASRGHVSLSGTVPTFSQSRIAERDAKDVVGTAWVTNLLTVNERMRSDQAILNDVRFEIRTDYALDLDKIKAHVKDGKVTLTGKVDSFWEKSHAYDVASRVSGVRGVDNNVKIDYPTAYSDAAIHSRISERLAVGAETHRIADNIKADVHGGKVTLTGSVNFWSEYDAAESIAFSVRGVREVNNQLTVEDYYYDWTAFLHP